MDFNKNLTEGYSQVSNEKYSIIGSDMAWRRLGAGSGFKSMVVKLNTQNSRLGTPFTTEPLKLEVNIGSGYSLVSLDNNNNGLSQSWPRSIWPHYITGPQ